MRSKIGDARATVSPFRSYHQLSVVLSEWLPTPSTNSSFRKRHPTLVRGGAPARVTFFFALRRAALAYASWALVCRGGRCPSDRGPRRRTRRARRRSSTRSTDGSSPSSASSGARWSRSTRSRKSCRTRSSSPRTSASTATRGIDWIRVPGAASAQHPRRHLRAGLLDDHDAARAQRLPRAHLAREKSPVRKLKEAKVARAIEAKYYEGQDPRAVPQSDQPRQRRLRRRDRVAALLRQVGARPEPRRSGDARRAAEGARRATIRAASPSARSSAATPSSRLMRRRRRDQRRRREPRQGVSAAARATRAESGDVAPYFVEWVRQQLDEKFGEQLYEQGLKVYTTLDLDMQSAAERALESQIRAIEGGRYGKFPHRTYEQLRRASGERRRDADAELAVPAGRVRRDGSAQRRGARAGRRPRLRRLEVQSRDAGAAAAGLDVQADRVLGRRSRTAGRRRTSSTTRRSGAAGRAARRGRRRTTTESSRDRSRCAARSTSRATCRRSALGMELGEQTRDRRWRASSASRRRFRRIRRSTSARPTSIPIEMIAAYTAFANLGMRAAPNAIVASRTRRAKCSGSRQPARAQVLSPEEAWLMVSMMKDVVRRGTAAGSVGARLPRSVPAERPARRTTAPTSGSSATRRISSPACGWASTGRRRSRRTRRAACSPRRRGRRS